MTQGYKYGNINNPINRSSLINESSINKNNSFINRNNSFINKKHPNQQNNIDLKKLASFSNKNIDFADSFAQKL